MGLGRFRVSGFGVESLGFQGFRVSRFWFGLQDLGVWVSRFRATTSRVSGFGVSGFRALGSGDTQRMEPDKRLLLLLFTITIYH